MDALGLFDLLTPYFLGGVDLGPALHTILSTVQVDQYDACYDEFGATVWGVARLDKVSNNPQFSTGPGSISFGTTATAANQPFPSNAGGMWDWNDVTFQFRIRIPRTPSATISSVVTTVSAAPPVLTRQATFLNLFNAWGYSTLPAATGTPRSVPPSDFPDSQFELDLMLTVATLHMPGLVGAQLGGDGMLTPDPANADVRFVLPKILLTLTQGATIGSVNLVLDSWGAETIDDPNDTGEAQLFQMIPPLALVNSSFGFGLDRLIIDTSDSHTPPDLLAQFGIGTDFKGLYVPDLRFFFAPGGQTGFACDIDVHDLIIDLADGFKFSADIEVDVINQDSNPYMRAVFYDTGGNTIAADCSTQRNSEFTIALPTDFTCAIEVHSAVPPYQIILNGSDITAAAGFTNHSLTAPTEYTIVAKAPDTPPDPHTGKDNTQATLILHVVPQAMSQAPTVIKTPSTDPLTLAPGPPQDGVHSIVLADSKAGKLQFSPGPPVAVQVTVTDDTNTQVFSQTLAGSDTIALTKLPPPGKSWKITAIWPSIPGTPAPAEVQAFFHFDRPPKPPMPQALPAGMILTPKSPYGVPRESDLADSGGHVETGTSKDSGSTGNFPEAFATRPEFSSFINQIPPGSTTAIEIRGFASYEHHDPMQQYNLELSERRATALAELIFRELAAKSSTAVVNFTTIPKGNDQDDPLLPGGVSAKTAWGPNNTADSSYDPSAYWMADARYQKTGAGTPQATVTATLTAPPQNTIVKPGPVTIQPTNSRNKSRPDWFRYARLLVRIQQNHFIALELSGEIKIDTAANDMLQQQAGDASLKGHGDPALTAKNLPANNNVADGTTDFDFILSHDDSTGTWAGQLTVAAAKNDKDGLLRFGEPPADDQHPPSNSIFFNFFGASIVFAPLIDAVAKSVTNKGALVQVGIDAGAVAAVGLIAASGVLQTETITLYGFTLSFSDGDAGISSAVMFDVEVDLYIDLLGLVKTRPTKPVKVRYKSVGVKVASKDPSGHPVLPIYFDPSKGYDIDLTDPGTFKLPGGLDDIIQVLGARIARTNPLNLELDIAMKDDFGVVSIDRAKVRWPIRDFGPPQLTALGASINIPGTIKASGYLDLSETGVAGSLDITIIPLGIRAKAELAVQKAEDGAGHTATGVAVSLLVQFPAPIVLGSSGLGIYGFIGLFAMHFKRTIPDATQWYITVNGDPTHVSKQSDWVASIGQWAFGAGLILGTLDGGIILNLKGVVVLELPGPRLLLFMTANILTPPPGLATSSGGTIMATLDLDFGRGTITIGLQIDYKIKPFVEIVIPGNAFFDFKNPANFSLDLGTIAKPATVKVLDSFNGSGYLMIHGNGIPDFHPPAAGLSGLAIAVGISVQLIWGDTSVGLYLEITGTAALGIGFSPFFMSGSLSIEGSLHLFIVSIGASGSLAVASNGSDTSISGSVCGKVSFFFFSVSGCVGFSIGPSTAPTVQPEDLMTSVYLQSRSPVLLEGTGTDRPIDTVLVHAPKSQGDPAFAISVPIDAIPVLQFAFTPCIDPSFTSATIAPPDSPPAPPATSTGWVKRGPAFYRYAITNIELTPLNGTPALSGKAPATWRQLGGAPTGDDRGIELALLSWVPFATPSAVVGSSSLDSQITTTFKDTCTPASPAAAVLWTFGRSPAGPSPKGWKLTGVAAVDPPGTSRSSPPPLLLTVRELWRSPLELANSVAMTTPAYVLSRSVPCSPPATAAPIAVGAPDHAAFDPNAALRFIVKSDAALDSFHTVAANVSRAPASPDMSRLVSLMPLQAADAVQLVPQISPEVISQMNAASTVPAAALTHFVAARPMVATEALKANSPVESRLQTTEPNFKLVTATTGFGVAGAGTAPTFVNKTCEGKLLVAPFQRTILPSPLSQDGLAGAIAKAAAAAGVDPVTAKNSDLSDALLFESEQPTRVRLTLWLATPVFRAQGLVLRAIDKEGNKLADFIIDNSNSTVLANPSKVPAEWLQTPWLAPSYPADAAAFLLQQTSSVMVSRLQLGMVVLVDVKLPAKTAKFITGLTSKGLEAAQVLPMSYAVAVVEAWSAAEDQRATFDQNTKISQQKTVAGALNNDPADLPLFSYRQQQTAAGLVRLPGQYSVAVTYTVQVAPVDDDGNMGKQGAVSAAKTDTYYFSTDPAPPAVLDPWILTAWPSKDEPFFFYKEPVTVVFSTNALQPLLKAYDVTLQGHSRAASFRHSDPNEKGPKKQVQALNPGGIGGLVFTPFEEALRNAMSRNLLPCINASGSTIKHSKQVFDVPLDPLTGYIFDLEESNAPAPPSSSTPQAFASVKPVFRAAFSTSRYGLLEEMLADISGSSVKHRHVASGQSSALAALSTSCSLADMDAALNAAGFGAMPAADIPVVTILWEDVPNTKARPAGVLIDLPEPIRRSRPTPTPAFDPNPQNDPARKNRIISWSLQPQIWLDVVEAGTSSSQKIAITSAGTRMYIPLKTGLPAGASLSLQVNRSATYPIEAANGVTSFPLLTLKFGNAPWEDA